MVDPSKGNIRSGRQLNIGFAFTENTVLLAPIIKRFSPDRALFLTSLLFHLSSISSIGAARIFD